MLLREHRQGCPLAHMSLHPSHTVHRCCHTVQMTAPSWPVLPRRQVYSTGSPLRSGGNAHLSLSSGDLCVQAGPVKQAALVR